jgi:hypothetical protein
MIYDQRKRVGCTFFMRYAKRERDGGVPSLFMRYAQRERVWCTLCMRYALRGGDGDTQCAYEMWLGGEERMYPGVGED